MAAGEYDNGHGRQPDFDGAERRVGCGRYGPPDYERFPRRVGFVWRTGRDPDYDVDGQLGDTQQQRRRMDFVRRSRTQRRRQWGIELQRLQHQRQRQCQRVPRRPELGRRHGAFQHRLEHGQQRDRAWVRQPEHRQYGSAFQWKLEHGRRLEPALFDA